MVLDDPFSGLDADTEELIFTRLFSRQGLFRRNGTTVLLATHGVHRLAYADHIICLGQDGSIVEQGTLEQLEAGHGYVATLEARQRVASDSENTGQPRHGRVAPDAVGHAELDPEANEAINIEADLTRQTGDFSLYLYYFGAVHWSSTALWVFLFFICEAAGKMGYFLVNFWTSAAHVHGNGANGFYLGMYGMLAATATIGLVGGAYHFILYFSPRGAEVLHQRVLNSVMNAPLSFFTSVDSGTTTNR